MNTTEQPVNPVRGCTCFRLRQLTRRVTQHYDSHLAAAGLRVTQYSLLSMLRGHVPLKLTQLADLMEMDRTTLTRNLKPLEQAGWVEIVVGEDARSRLVALTPAGRAVWEQGKSHWRAAQNALNTLLGMPEVGELHAVLDAALRQFQPEGSASA